MRVLPAEGRRRRRSVAERYDTKRIDGGHYQWRTNLAARHGHLRVRGIDDDIRAFDRDTSIGFDQHGLAKRGIRIRDHVDDADIQAASVLHSNRGGERLGPGNYLDGVGVDQIRQYGAGRPLWAFRAFMAGWAGWTLRDLGAVCACGASCAGRAGHTLGALGAGYGCIS